MNVKGTYKWEEHLKGDNDKEVNLSLPFDSGAEQIGEYNYKERTKWELDGFSE